MIEFQEFPKIPRLRREITISEKIDGTNAQVMIVDDPDPAAHWLVTTVETDKYRRGIFAGSRNRWLAPGKNTDNFGFAQWVLENADELAHLGPGRHYGEWWGQGIQRTYDLSEKRFSLFNVSRWLSHHDLPMDQEWQQARFPTAQYAPECCHVVPAIYNGPFRDGVIDRVMDIVRDKGSVAALGYMNPEGIVVFHSAGNCLFKQTFEKDEEPKSLRECANKLAA